MCEKQKKYYSDVMNRIIMFNVNGYITVGIIIFTALLSITKGIWFSMEYLIIIIISIKFYIAQKLQKLSIQINKLKLTKPIDFNCSFTQKAF